jgi:signal transduction histidine kinase
MGKPSQSSFRRILFSRILLLIIPVLLAGEYVVYRKARWSVLETAHQTLAESAVHQANAIRAMAETLKSSLWIASETFTNQVDRPGAARSFVQKLQKQLPPSVQCVQLTNLQTEQLEGSTCGSQAIQPIPQQVWSKERPKLALTEPNLVLSTSAAPPDATNHAQSLLKLAFSAPVYDTKGQLRYMLSAQSILHRYDASQRPTWTESTIIFAQDGTILAHPERDRIQQNLRQLPNPEPLQVMLNQAIAGKRHHDSIMQNGKEQLVNYSTVQMMRQAGQPQTWVVLAMAPIDDALYELRGIKVVLGALTLGLIGASLLATIYIAKNLANPVEKLGRYALQISSNGSSGSSHALVKARSPEPFRIRELDQLATVLNKMVQRLEERAEELETAWQEAQTANQHMSSFLAITSHELRTPLNAIIGCVRLVRDDCCDSRQEELEFLQQADEAALHLLRVINDILDISRIEAGTVELNCQPVYIPDLCQQCIRMMQTHADKKQIHLSLHLEDAIAQVTLDEQRVRQMLINLLSNAIKFTPEYGSVNLKAYLAKPPLSSIAAPHLCLQVVDTGIGIPKSQWHLLFRPFQQVNSTHSRKQEGTGLGLALTKRLTELHGGMLTFDSTPGRGSKFCLWLPIR